MGINPTTNKLSLSEDFTVITAWEKNVAFPPPLLQMPYLQTRNHEACVQLIHFPSNSRSNTEVGCKFNYPHVQNRNRISLLNLFSYVGKIKNKRSWSGLCEWNVFQFIKPWGNEMRAPEGFLLPHGIIIISQCFFSEIFVLTSVPQKRFQSPSLGLEFLQIISNFSK